MKRQVRSVVFTILLPIVRLWQEFWIGSFLKLMKKSGNPKKERIADKAKTYGHLLLQRIEYMVDYKKKMRATVTAYDWEYLSGGHVSGGTLSLLFMETQVFLFVRVWENIHKRNRQICRSRGKSCMNALPLGLSTGKKGSYTAVFMNPGVWLGCRKNGLL